MRQLDEETDQITMRRLARWWQWIAIGLFVVVIGMYYQTCVAAEKLGACEMAKEGP